MSGHGVIVCQDTEPTTEGDPMAAQHTPKHSVRVPDDLWESARRAAEAQGTTVSAVVVQALRRYARRYDPEGKGTE